ncbi:MAG: hypothetical protein GYB31_07465 [Bacteroidetes bacterium]|nr:hypothetical protein [Bacteroidota bacterium]
MADLSTSVTIACESGFYPIGDVYVQITCEGEIRTYAFSNIQSEHCPPITKAWKNVSNNTSISFHVKGITQQAGEEYQLPFSTKETLVAVNAKYKNQLTIMLNKEDWDYSIGTDEKGGTGGTRLKYEPRY